MQNNAGTLVRKKKSIYALCAVFLLVICTLVICIIGYYLYSRPPITHAFGYKFGAKIDKYQKETQLELDMGSHELYDSQLGNDVPHVAPLLTDGIDGFNNHCLIHVSGKSHSIYEINIFNQNDMSANKDELDWLYKKNLRNGGYKIPIMEALC